jgi:hypothetical protein
MPVLVGKVNDFKIKLYRVRVDIENLLIIE